MRGGYYRPMHLHRARIGFDERGKVLAWDHVIVGQSVTAGSVFEQFRSRTASTPRRRRACVIPTRCRCA